MTASVSAADVNEAYASLAKASEDAGSNTASEDRCVDVLKTLAAMKVPVKLFVSGEVGDAAKAIKKLAKKGPTDAIKAEASACVAAWKKIMLGAVEGGEDKDKEDADAAAATTTTKKEVEGGESGGAKKEEEDGDGDGEKKDASDGETNRKKLLEPALGDPLRDRTRELLAEAIAQAIGAPDVYASVEDVAQTAIAIENAMHAQWSDTGKEYKAKFRQLSFNLKDPKNPDLRRSVADGLISPAVLLDLSPEELGSDERRNSNAKIREHATNEAVRGQKKEASTDAFKCGKCKQRKCTYYQLQTRSADEPMTTFVTCVNCDNRWKFC
jgi:transcription elongation factor S-II